MGYVEWTLLALIISVFVLTAFLRMLSKDLREEQDVGNRRDNACRKAIASMAQNLIDQRERMNELERRLGCVENDLEKIPVEEVNAEVQRLERFNDGIASIMGYGPDVPRLNKEAVKK
jgi:septal ring factor EnvC (AmiA/AmiB activator)